MSRHYVQLRRAIAFVGILVATASSAPLALAQYTFVRDSDNNDVWTNTGRWLLSGSPSPDYPNGTDVSATIDAPTTTQPLVPMNVYTLTLPATHVTLGDLTITHTSANAYRTNINSASSLGHLKFQSSSGPATYTETLGSINPTFTANTQYQFQLPVDILSDLIITQENYPNANTGTTFTQIVTGAVGRTITKEGYGSIQFNYNALPGEVTYEGQYIINRGGIRMLINGQMQSSSGITVNSGGQLQLADNNNITNLDWSLATGAVLNLNGVGKAELGPNEVASADGALRFSVLAAHPTTAFHNNVVLQSDSVITVSTAGTTATLDGIVSGAGGLTVHGSGTLVLSHTSTHYDGDTSVSGVSTLRINSAFWTMMPT